MRNYRHPIIGNGSFRKVEDILRSGVLSAFRGTPEGHLGGYHVQALEEAFRDYFQVKHAVSMNSATAALHAACIALIKPGDEVIVSPYTFASSATCALMVGAKPVFVDIEEDIFCIDPKCIEKAITPKTKAIIPVHLMGHPASMFEIMNIAEKYNLAVIEDAAQAIGAKYRGRYCGTIGNCGVFSFNQSKPISTGEGGMLITNDDHIARVARAVRNHGEVSDPELGIFGFNYRLCEIEASLALSQFKKLDEMNDYRRFLADYLSPLLPEGFTPPVIHPSSSHVYYTYGVRTKFLRDRIQQELIKRGIYFGSGYVKPLYHLPAFGGMNLNLPVVERMYQKELMVTDRLRFPATKHDMDEIIFKLKEVLCQLKN